MQGQVYTFRNVYSRAIFRVVGDDAAARMAALRGWELEQ